LVAPELRGPMRNVTRLALPTHHGWRLHATRALLAVMPDGKLEGVTIEKVQGISADVPGNGPRVRVYRPVARRSTAALFWIHGGGLIFGRAVQDDHLCALTARDLGILVVSVEYRMAPEHPFPAALDDCLAGWRWLQREAPRLGVDPARVALGGESAGGGLAASLAQRLHDSTHDSAAKPVAQWLFCPMLDDRTAARQELDGADHFVWNNRLNRFGWRSYLGVEPGATSVPTYAAPARRENLRSLPPAWIGVGDIELFYDETRDYAERLRAASVEVTLDIVPGAPHGFESWAANTSIARAYLGRAREWLSQALVARE
ncbi:MAG TPA: alpha/beta hydrolase, partial [Ktedonobacterales bacterium]|nr:alpha/beta hydrolase [Ktedonobacterales bacterium]